MIYVFKIALGNLIYFRESLIFIKSKLGFECNFDCREK